MSHNGIALLASTGQRAPLPPPGCPRPQPRLPLPPGDDRAGFLRFLRWLGWSLLVLGVVVALSDRGCGSPTGVGLLSFPLPQGQTEDTPTPTGAYEPAEEAGRAR